MDAAPRLNRRHTGAQVDPELGIALAETDRRRPRHQSRKPERRQRQFIKSRGTFEVADANGNMIDHEVLRRFLPSLRVGTGGRHRPALDESLRLDVGSMTPFLSDFLPRSEATKQSILPPRRNGLLRFARNDGES